MLGRYSLKQLRTTKAVRMAQVVAGSVFEPDTDSLAPCVASTNVSYRPTDVEEVKFGSNATSTAVR
jgi:hypothetical protein